MFNIVLLEIKCALTSSAAFEGLNVESLTLCSPFLRLATKMSQPLWQEKLGRRFASLDEDVRGMIDECQAGRLLGHLGCALLDLSDDRRRLPIVAAQISINYLAIGETALAGRTIAECRPAADSEPLEVELIGVLKAYVELRAWGPSAEISTNLARVYNVWLSAIDPNQYTEVQVSIL